MFLRIWRYDVMMEHCMKGFGAYKDDADLHIILGTVRIIVSRRGSSE